MQKRQRKEIKNFNYFVQYIKELIFKNKEKYQLEAIGEIEFSVPKIFNSKKKCWDLLFSTSKNNKIYISKFNCINQVIEDIADIRAKNFKNQYSDFATKITESLLNSYDTNIKYIKQDFIRHISRQTEYSVYEISILGLFLRSKSFEIKIKNLNKVDIIIEFLPIKLEEIKNLLNTTNISPFHFESYGLKVKFKMNKSLGVTSYYEQEEASLLRNIFKLLYVSNVKILNWKTYTEPKTASLWGPGNDVNILNLPFRKILKQRDKNILINFYREIREYLIKQEILEHLKYNQKARMYQSIMTTQRTISPYSVALEYYNEALDISISQPNKIITTILMGLEALYTTKDCDLAYTLRMRITTLFNILGITDISILNIIKKGYDVRSDYAHGGIKRKQKWKKLLEIGQFENDEECIRYFLNILRISLLIALILNNKTINNKKVDISYFQNLIDETMLGEQNAKIQIKKELKLYKILFNFN